LLIGFLVILFAIISVIVLVARSKDLRFMLEYDRRAAENIKLFGYIVLYSQMIPVSMYFFLDMITFFNKIQKAPEN
jgi:magnesium-transporting ATPase (P-type)